jgi:prevent-host-death family protein
MTGNNDHMTRTVTAAEAKATILALLDDVAGGEEFTITKRGGVVARLVPAGGSHALKDMFAGVATTADPDDELLSTGVDWNLG